MSDQRAILQRVDLVLAVGTDPFEELFYWGDVILPLDARLVHIDPSPGRIGRSEPTDVGIVGHCASALADLTAVLMERWSPGDRSEIEERRQAVASEKRNNRENFDKAAADRWDHKPMSPARMMFELAAAVPDNAVVVDDSISNRGAMRHYSRPPAWGTCWRPGPGYRWRHRSDHGRPVRQSGPSRFWCHRRRKRHDDGSGTLDSCQRQHPPSLRHLQQRYVPGAKGELQRLPTGCAGVAET